MITVINIIFASNYEIGTLIKRLGSSILAFHFLLNFTNNIIFLLWYVNSRSMCTIDYFKINIIFSRYDEMNATNV